MAISNLLSLTIRKNGNYEPEVKELAQVNNDASEQYLQGVSLNDPSNGDSVSINGRVLGIMGAMTDEQIEKVMKIGLNQSVDKMTEIITTCGDMSDEEIINTFLGRKNPEGIPQRLRIIRKNNPNPVPSEPSTEPDEPSNPDQPSNPDEPNKPGTRAGGETDYTLERKSVSGDTKNSLENVQVDSDGSRFKLTNSIDGKEYKYTISSYKGSDATITSIEYLDNDRLLIVGDNLKIVADEGQNDNIILMGNNNYLDTNSGDDTIRVGIVQDSFNDFYDYWYNEKDDTYYFNNLQGNIIYSGSGDDYIENSGANQIDMGTHEKGDYFYDNNNYINSEGGQKWMSSLGLKNPAGYEKTFVSGSSQTADYTLGAATQGSYGDCKFLSFLNSFNGDLKDYVSYTRTNNGYDVTFLKSGYSVKVLDDELDNETNALNKLLYYQNDSKSKMTDKENAEGDIDNILVEVAFRKLISYPSNNDGTMYNMDNEDDGEEYTEKGVTYTIYNGDTQGNKVYSNADEHNNNEFGWSSNNFLLSKYFYGTEGCGSYTILQNNSDDWFTGMLRAYQNGTITQLVVGTHDSSDNMDNGKLGIYSNHAYAIKGFVENQYVEVINPWDSKDVIKLDWNDFFKYFESVNLFGDSYTYANSKESSGAYTGLKPVEVETLQNTGGYQSFIQKENINRYIRLSQEENNVYDEIDDITSNIEAVKALCVQEKKLELYS